MSEGKWRGPNIFWSQIPSAEGFFNGTEKFVGWDMGAKDETIYSVRSGMKFGCNIPPELGTPTNMRVQNGGVIVETESGVTFIVPRSK